MSYGDLPIDAPHKPNKGIEGGACNRQRCQVEPALYYNHGSNAWYCEDCKRDIGDDVVNRLDWLYKFEHTLGHPQFETREEMESRKKRPEEEATETMVGVRGRMHYMGPNDTSDPFNYSWMVPSGPTKAHRLIRKKPRIRGGKFRK